MRHSKEIVTAAGTLVLAMGIGFVMQSSETAKERYGVRTAPEAEKEQVQATPEFPTQVQKGASLLPELSDIHLTSASFPRVRAASGYGIDADHLVKQVATTQATNVAMPAQPCNYETNATAITGGLVIVELDAPCQPNEQLTVHHNGLMFSETTDANGHLKTIVPALSSRAVFMMQFANGDGAAAQTSVSELPLFGRAVLQWHGDAGFQLHAREFGADYGSTGHIWSGTESPVHKALEDNHGFVLRLGNPDVNEPFLAEVYTYPLVQSEQRGTIDLTIEAEIHARNCGLDIEAQSIELVGGDLKTQDVVLSIPDCEAIGSFLVLNNLVSDMKVAAK